MEKTTFTISEMAEYLSIGRNKAYELVKTNTIPALKIGRQIRIPIKSLNKWIEDTANQNVQ